jgi:hypothetical protein
MSVTLTRNLRLRLDSSLTSDSKYNLNRLDLLGSSLTINTNESTSLRSSSDIFIEPEALSLGGLGSGGSVSIGSPGHQIAALRVFASSVSFESPIGIRDSDSSFLLLLRHASGGDSTANRTLSLDLDNSDRSIRLGGNLSLAGALTTSGAFPVSLTATAATSLVLPVSGQLATLDDIAAAGIPDQSGNAGKVLSTNGSITQWSSAGTGDVSSYSTSWSYGEGSSKTVTHGLGSTGVVVSIIDQADGLSVGISNITVIDSNSIQLGASEAPATTWRVIVHAS